MKGRFRGVAFCWALVLLVLQAVPLAMSSAQTPSSEGDIVAIRFGNQDFGLYVMQADGAEKRRLELAGNSNGDPKWSPDGSQIAYVDYETQTLHVISADGLVDRIVVDDVGGPTGGCYCDFNWSPDGNWIAYAAHNGGDSSAIWVVSSDGTQRKQLTDEAKVSDFSPVWSPDGQRIAFVSDRSSPRVERDWEIYTMSSDGSDVKQLTRTLESAGALRDSVNVYAWSPDDEILFIGDGDVWTVHADGTAATRLTNTRYPKVDTAPLFSPDGMMIAFSRFMNYCCEQPKSGKFCCGGTLEIFVIHRSTGARNRLTNNDLGDYLADWSPSGGRLLYTTELWPRGMVIKTMAPDGSDKQRLTTRRGAWGNPDWRSSP